MLCCVWAVLAPWCTSCFGVCGQCGCPDVCERWLSIPNKILRTLHGSTHQHCHPPNIARGSSILRKMNSQDAPRNSAAMRPQQRECRRFETKPPDAPQRRNGSRFETKFPRCSVHQSCHPRKQRERCRFQETLFRMRHTPALQNNEKMVDSDNTTTMLGTHYDPTPPPAQNCKRVVRHSDVHSRPPAQNSEKVVDSDKYS